MNEDIQTPNQTIKTKRILVLADFACSTGFAQVAQNIVAQLLQQKEPAYQVDVVGINYYGLPTEWQDLFPRVRLFPANLISRGDVFGREGFLQMLSSGQYDYAWILQDTFNIEPIATHIKKIRTQLLANGRKGFKWVFYFPIDAAPKENWVTQSVSMADAPVVYTQYGYEECLKFDKTLEKRLRVIPHGTDLKVFHPMPEESVAQFRKAYFMGRADDKFLVTNVNRNQPRKDVARSLQIFKLFKQQCPEAILYLHMKARDVAYDLNEVARNFGLIPDQDYIVPKDFDEHDGVSLDIMNYIYNASDAVMTTTLGEGWGLSITESMACKTPVLAPAHTSINEMMADGRGLLIPAGKTVDDFVCIANDNERVRPVVSIIDFVEKLVWLRNNYKTPEVTDMVERAYKHVTEEWNWDKIGQQWRDLFLEIEPKAAVARVGRNDPCPECLKEGVTIKYKKCERHFSQ